MRFRWLYALAGAAPVALLAFSTGPPIKRTGNVDGGLDCSGCHRTFAPANSDPRGSVKIEGLQNYVPGVAQTIKITISHPDAARWGFQATARFVSGKSTVTAGKLTALDTITKVVCDDGTLRGAAGPCQPGQLEWIEHSDAQRTPPGTGSYTYTFQWTPPAEENGDIVFYFAGNAADGTGSPANDHIYTNQARISSGAPCSISRKPSVAAAVNAGSHSGAFSPNGMVEIYGKDFQDNGRKRAAGEGDFRGGSFPQELGCMAVEITSVRAPVTYVQENQINVQAPTTFVTGPVTLTVIANPGRPNELRSDPVTVILQSPAPAFFTIGSSGNLAAQIAGTSTVVARPALVATGARPAKPGETVTLYGTGFGTTNPGWRAGQIPTASANLVGTATVTIGGTAAKVTYIGVSPGSISGLCQINVEVPAGIADGDQPVVATVGGVTTQSGVFLPIQR